MLSLAYMFKIHNVYLYKKHIKQLYVKSAKKCKAFGNKNLYNFREVKTSKKGQIAISSIK